jgi:DDE superfamily endonuclease
MEDVLDLYERPYSREFPVICFDERPCVLHGQVVQPVPMKPGKPEREDYEYTRNGTGVVMVAVEPLTGWRLMRVFKQRRAIDYARFMNEVAHHPHFAGAKKILVVQDNLNTHLPSAFYKRYTPETARRLAERFEMHYTPKKGSWLNMAEIEICVLSRACLKRRIDSLELLQTVVRAHERSRNRMRAKITWRFTTLKARDKFARHYREARAAERRKNREARQQAIKSKKTVPKH